MKIVNRSATVWSAAAMSDVTVRFREPDFLWLDNQLEFCFSVLSFKNSFSFKSFGWPEFLIRMQIWGMQYATSKVKFVIIFG